MVNKYIKKIYLAVIACCIFQLNGFAQKDTSGTTFYVEPDFKGFQVDLATIGFIYSIGTAFDFDIIKIKRDHWMSLGVRLGAEYCYIYTGDLFGSTVPKKNVKFFDYNFYPRFTSDFKVVRMDFYLGGTYHHVSEVLNDYGRFSKNNKVFLKGGLDFKVKLFNKYAGLIGKLVFSGAETFGGIGIFVGYGKEY